jgi:cell division protease FtsH
MSDQLGTVAWGEKQEEVFLGRDYTRRSQDYSEDTAQRIDHEVRRLVGDGYELARNVLAQNQHILHKVAQVLLDKETIDGPEFERMVAQMNPLAPEPSSSVA